ncbi:flagellar assembly protein FliH [Colwellia sp. RE-S-Sl-9]
MSQKIVKGSSEVESDLWSIPNVEQAQQVDDGKTNALGKKSSWKYEPPEETEIEEPTPLTAEDIEEIRQAAHEEGFNQGKEEGFAKGYDEGKSSGHEEGLKTGHEEGVATGLSEGKETIDNLAQEWQTLVQQLHTPLADVEKNVEEQLLHLVVQLTQAITLQEAKINPDIITAAIGEGIKMLPSQEAQTQILVHPEDIKIVEEQFGADYIIEQGWKLLAAPQLERGSCQIENSTSNIDLSIKSRMKDVLESFLQDALHQ